MGLIPVSGHSAFVTFSPNKRRYKLYGLENARPANLNAGYSLLSENGTGNHSEEVQKQIEAALKRLRLQK